MTNVLRLAVCDPNDASRQDLKTMLLGIDVVWLDADCSRYEFFADVVGQTEPDLALISLDSNPAKALELTARIHHEKPSCQLLVVSGSTEGSLILQAMRNGAREFLSAPLKLDDFLSALERVRHLTKGTSTDTPVRSSKVVSVAGVCGGVGCTSLAINLGCCLAQEMNRQTAIIDMDLALGDADVWLDIIPDYTIQDVAENITRLDYAMLKRSLTRHDCGAFLLPRPVEMADHLPLAPDELRRVISLLKATFTHLVIDLSKSYGPLDIAAMEASDDILLVTQLDLPSLRNAVRLMQFLQQHDGLIDKVRIIVNRLGLEENQISLTKALETLGHEVYLQIPNDYATMVEARNNGVPLLTQAPRAKLTKSIQQLAQLLSPGAVSDDKTDDKKSRKGLFSFLGSSK